MSSPARPSAIRAFASGVATVVGAPLVLAAVVLVTIAVAAPFALVLGARVQQSLNAQPPVSLDDTEIDPEWWSEYRAHAQGLEATFTPAILGFAAPLDGLSAVLDGRRPAVGVIGPLAASILAWALLWGGILHRFNRNSGVGAGEFLRACFGHAPRLLAISVLASVLVIALYAMVHPLLFGPIYRALASGATTEFGAFVVRVVLYVAFLVPLMGVALVADYARVFTVAGRTASVPHALRSSIAFIRANIRAVVLLYLMAGAVFVAVTVGYGALEILGGARVGGWRAIVLGQAYIVVRLAIRLSIAASELRLFRAIAG